jgi:hypothetical protein
MCFNTGRQKEGYIGFAGGNFSGKVIKGKKCSNDDTLSRSGNPGLFFLASGDHKNSHT